MNLLFAKHFLLYFFLIIALGAGAWYSLQYYTAYSETKPETTAVLPGDIAQTVTVSGKIEAEQMATLGFAVNGTIKNIFKQPGDIVVADEVIASLTSDSLIAEYNSQLEQVRSLEQVKQALLRGPVETERAVSRTTVDVAKAALAQVEAEYEQAVANARRELLSNNLVAYPSYVQNDDIPPQITGSYLCDEEGSYTISLFASNSYSNLSYRLSGLGFGTYTGSTDTPTPLGNCGLYIQFDDSESYRRSDWIVPIPNTRSGSYVAAKNAYDLLLTKRDAAIQTARENLALAENTKEALIAKPSSEAIRQAEANIAAAKARLDVITAQIVDYTIRAPFAGIITDVDMKVGEPTGPEHRVTIIYEGDYELRAQIPEIDITKVQVGNRATVTFDAMPETEFTARITFISPRSVEIGGVAYYDAHIGLDTTPTWIREGLNGDVVIESQKVTGVSRLPKRFLSNESGAQYVFIPQADGVAQKTPVETGFSGTDGYIEVKNLPNGTVVQIP